MMHGSGGRFDPSKVSGPQGQAAASSASIRTRTTGNHASGKQRFFASAGPSGLRVVVRHGSEAEDLVGHEDSLADQPFVELRDGVPNATREGGDSRQREELQHDAGGFSSAFIASTSKQSSRGFSRNSSKMSSSTARSGSTLFSAGGGRNNRGAARGARSTEERNGETDSHTAGRSDPFTVRGSASGHTSSCSEEEGVMAFPSELTSGVQAVRVPQSEGPSSKTNRDDALADFEKNGRKEQAAVMGGISGAAPLLINHIRLGGREGGGALSTSDGSGASQAASIPRENKSSGFSSALKPMLQTVNGASASSKATTGQPQPGGRNGTKKFAPSSEPAPMVIKDSCFRNSSSSADFSLKTQQTSSGRNTKSRLVIEEDYADQDADNREKAKQEPSGREATSVHGGSWMMRKSSTSIPVTAGATAIHALAGGSSATTPNSRVTKSGTGGANATTEAKLHRMMAIMNSGGSGDRGAAPFGAVGNGSPPSRTAMPLPDSEVPLQSGGAFSGTDVNYAASDTMLPPTEAAPDPLQAAPRSPSPHNRSQHVAAEVEEWRLWDALTSATNPSNAPHQKSSRTTMHSITSGGVRPSFLPPGEEPSFTSGKNANLSLGQPPEISGSSAPRPTTNTATPQLEGDDPVDASAAALADVKEVFRRAVKNPLGLILCERLGIEAEFYRREEENDNEVDRSDDGTTGGSTANGGFDGTRRKKLGGYHDPSLWTIRDERRTKKSSKTTTGPGVGERRSSRHGEQKTFAATTTSTAAAGGGSTGTQLVTMYNLASSASGSSASGSASATSSARSNSSTSASATAAATSATPALVPSATSSSSSAVFADCGGTDMVNLSGGGTGESATVGTTSGATGSFSARQGSARSDRETTPRTDGASGSSYSSSSSGSGSARRGGGKGGPANPNPSLTNLTNLELIDEEDSGATTASTPGVAGAATGAAAASPSSSWWLPSGAVATATTSAGTDAARDGPAKAGESETSASANGNVESPTSKLNTMLIRDSARSTTAEGGSSSSRSGTSSSASSSSASRSRTAPAGSGIDASSNAPAGGMTMTPNQDDHTWRSEQDSGSRTEFFRIDSAQDSPVSPQRRVDLAAAEKAFFPDSPLGRIGALGSQHLGGQQLVMENCCLEDVPGAGQVEVRIAEHVPVPQPGTHVSSVSAGADVERSFCSARIDAAARVVEVVGNFQYLRSHRTQSHVVKVGRVKPTYRFELPRRNVLAPACVFRTEALDDCVACEGGPRMVSLRFPDDFPTITDVTACQVWFERYLTFDAINYEDQIHGSLLMQLFSLYRFFLRTASAGLKISGGSLAGAAGGQGGAGFSASSSKAAAAKQRILRVTERSLQCSILAYLEELRLKTGVNACDKNGRTVLHYILDDEFFASCRDVDLDEQQESPPQPVLGASSAYYLSNGPALVHRQHTAGEELSRGSSSCSASVLQRNYVTFVKEEVLPRLLQHSYLDGRFLNNPKATVWGTAYAGCVLSHSFLEFADAIRSHTLFDPEANFNRVAGPARDRSVLLTRLLRLVALRTTEEERHAWSLSLTSAADCQTVEMKPEDSDFRPGSLLSSYEIIGTGDGASPPWYGGLQSQLATSAKPTRELVLNKYLPVITRILEHPEFTRGVNCVTTGAHGSRMFETPLLLAVELESLELCERIILHPNFDCETNLIFPARALDSPNASRSDGGRLVFGNCRSLNPVTRALRKLAGLTSAQNTGPSAAMGAGSGHADGPNAITRTTSQALAITLPGRYWTDTAYSPLFPSRPPTNRSRMCETTDLTKVGPLNLPTSATNQKVLINILELLLDASGYEIFQLASGKNSQTSLRGDILGAKSRRRGNGVRTDGRAAGDRIGRDQLTTGAVGAGFAGEERPFELTLATQGKDAARSLWYDRRLLAMNMSSLRLAALCERYEQRKQFLKFYAGAEGLRKLQAGRNRKALVLKNSEQDVFREAIVEALEFRAASMKRRARPRVKRLEPTKETLRVLKSGESAGTKMLGQEASTGTMNTDGGGKVLGGGSASSDIVRVLGKVRRGKKSGAKKKRKSILLSDLITAVVGTKPQSESEQRTSVMPADYYYDEEGRGTQHATAADTLAGATSEPEASAADSQLLQSGASSNRERASSLKERVLASSTPGKTDPTRVSRSLKRSRRRSAAAASSVGSTGGSSVGRQFGGMQVVATASSKGTTVMSHADSKGTVVHIEESPGRRSQDVDLFRRYQREVLGEVLTSASDTDRGAGGAEHQDEIVLGEDHESFERRTTSAAVVEVDVEYNSSTSTRYLPATIFEDEVGEESARTRSQSSPPAPNRAGLRGANDEQKTRPIDPAADAEHSDGSGTVGNATPRSPSSPSRGGIFGGCLSRMVCLGNARANPLEGLLRNVNEQERPRLTAGTGKRSRNRSDHGDVDSAAEEFDRIVAKANTAERTPKIPVSNVSVGTIRKRDIAVKPRNLSVSPTAPAGAEETGKQPPLALQGGQGEDEKHSAAVDQHDSVAETNDSAAPAPTQKSKKRRRRHTTTASAANAGLSSPGEFSTFSLTEEESGLSTAENTAVEFIAEARMQELQGAEQVPTGRQAEKNTAQSQKEKNKKMSTNFGLFMSKHLMGRGVADGGPAGKRMTETENESEMERSRASGGRTESYHTTTSAACTEESHEDMLKGARGIGSVSQTSFDNDNQSQISEDVDDVNEKMRDAGTSRKKTALTPEEDALLTAISAGGVEAAGATTSDGVLKPVAGSATEMETDAEESTTSEEQLFLSYPPDLLIMSDTNGTAFASLKSHHLLGTDRFFQGFSSGAVVPNLLSNHNSVEAAGLSVLQRERRGATTTDSTIESRNFVVVLLLRPEHGMRLRYDLDGGILGFREAHLAGSIPAKQLLRKGMKIYDFGHFELAPVSSDPLGDVPVDGGRPSTGRGTVVGVGLQIEQVVTPVVEPLCQLEHNLQNRWRATAQGQHDVITPRNNSEDSLSTSAFQRPLWIRFQKNQRKALVTLATKQDKLDIEYVCRDETVEQFVHLRSRAQRKTSIAAFQALHSNRVFYVPDVMRDDEHQSSSSATRDELATVLPGDRIDAFIMPDGKHYKFDSASFHHREILRRIRPLQVEFLEEFGDQSSFLATINDEFRVVTSMCDESSSLMSALSLNDCVDVEGDEVAALVQAPPAARYPASILVPVNDAKEWNPLLRGCSAIPSADTADPLTEIVLREKTVSQNIRLTQQILKLLTQLGEWDSFLRVCDQIAELKPETTLLRVINYGVDLRTKSSVDLVQKRLLSAETVGANGESLGGADKTGEELLEDDEEQGGESVDQDAGSQGANCSQSHDDFLDDVNQQQQEQDHDAEGTISGATNKPSQENANSLLAGALTDEYFPLEEDAKRKSAEFKVAAVGQVASGAKSTTTTSAAGDDDGGVDYSVDVEDTSADIPGAVKLKKKSVRFSTESIKFKSYDGRKQKSEWLLDDAFADLQKLQSSFAELAPALKKLRRATRPTLPGISENEAAVFETSTTVETEKLRSTRSTSTEIALCTPGAQVERRFALERQKSDMLRRFFSASLNHLGKEIFASETRAQQRPYGGRRRRGHEALMTPHVFMLAAGTAEFGLVQRRSGGKLYAQADKLHELHYLLDSHGLHPAVFRRSRFGPGDLVLAALRSVSSAGAQVLQFLLSSPAFFLNCGLVSLTERVRAFGLLLAHTANQDSTSPAVVAVVLENLVELCEENGLAQLGTAFASPAVRNLFGSEDVHLDHVETRGSDDRGLASLNSRNTHIVPGLPALDSRPATRRSGTATPGDGWCPPVDGEAQLEASGNGGCGGRDEISEEATRIELLKAAVQKILHAAYHIARLRGNAHFCRQILHLFAKIPMLLRDPGSPTPATPTGGAAARSARAAASRPHLLRVPRPTEASGVMETMLGKAVASNPQGLRAATIPGIRAGDRLVRVHMGDEASDASIVEHQSFRIKKFEDASDVTLLQKCTSNVLLEFDTRPIENSGLLEAVRGNDVEWCVGVLWNCFAGRGAPSAPSSRTGRISKAASATTFANLYLPPWSSLQSTDWIASSGERSRTGSPGYPSSSRRGRWALGDDGNYMDSDEDRTRSKDSSIAFGLAAKAAVATDTLWMVALQHCARFGAECSNETIFSEFWDGYDTEKELRNLVFFGDRDGKAPEILEKTQTAVGGSWKMRQSRARGGYAVGGEFSVKTWREPAAAGSGNAGNSFFASAASSGRGARGGAVSSAGEQGRSAGADQPTARSGFTRTGGSYGENDWEQDSDLDWLPEESPRSTSSDSSVSSSPSNYARSDFSTPVDERADEIEANRKYAAENGLICQEVPVEANREKQSTHGGDQDASVATAAAKKRGQRGGKNTATKVATTKKITLADPRLADDYPTAVAVYDRKKQRKHLLTVLLEQLIFGPICCLELKEKHLQREREEQEKQVEERIEQRCKERVAEMKKKKWVEPPAFVDCGRCGWGMPSGDLLVALHVDRPADEEEGKETKVVPFWERKHTIWKFKRPGQVPRLKLPEQSLEPYTPQIAPRILSSSEDESTASEEDSDGEERPNFHKTADRENAEMQKTKEARRKKLQKYRNDTRFQLVEVAPGTREIMSEELQQWIGMDRRKEVDILKPMNVDDIAFSDSDSEFEKTAITKLLAGGNVLRAVGMSMVRENAITGDLIGDPKLNKAKMHSETQKLLVGNLEKQEIATKTKAALSEELQAALGFAINEKGQMEFNDEAGDDADLDQSGLGNGEKHEDSSLEEEAAVNLKAKLLKKGKFSAKEVAYSEWLRERTAAAKESESRPHQDNSSSATGALIPNKGALGFLGKVLTVGTATAATSQDLDNTNNAPADSGFNFKAKVVEAADRWDGRSKNAAETSAGLQRENNVEHGPANIRQELHPDALLPGCHQIWIETLAQVQEASGKNLLMLAIEDRAVHANVIELILKACALQPKVLYEVLRHRDHLHETCTQKANRLERHDVLALLKRHFRV